MERYRFHSDGAVFFTTFAVVQWLPVFVSEDACKIVVDSLNFCHRSKGLRTNAYVIMPTHMHAIFFDAAFDAKRLEKTLVDLRKFTGRQQTRAERARRLSQCPPEAPTPCNDSTRLSLGQP